MSLGQFSSQPLPPEREPRCPNCGATITPGAVYCWMCDEDIVPSGNGASLLDQDLAERIKLPKNKPDVGTYVVGFIVLLVVSFGLTLVAPGLWIVLLVVGMPALIYFSVSGSQRNTQGDLIPTSPALRALSIVATIALVGIASVVAFFAVCFGVGLGVMGLAPSSDFGGGILCGLVAGLIAALAVTRFILRSTFFRK